MGICRISKNHQSNIDEMLPLNYIRFDMVHHSVVDFSNLQCLCVVQTVDARALQGMAGRWHHMSTFRCILSITVPSRQWYVILLIIVFAKMFWNIPF